MVGILLVGSLLLLQGDLFRKEWKRADPGELAAGGVRFRVEGFVKIPWECYWILRKGKLRKRIGRLSDFAGYVRIRNSKAALGYVRLGDENPDGPFLYTDHAEIHHVPRLTPLSYVYGGDDEHVREGDGALVSDRVWHELGMQEPHVMRTRDGWNVERTALMGDWHHTWPYRITETVTRHGTYKVVARRRLEVPPGDYHWSFMVVRIAIPAG